MPVFGSRIRIPRTRNVAKNTFVQLLKHIYNSTNTCCNCHFFYLLLLELSELVIILTIWKMNFGFSLHGFLCCESKNKISCAAVLCRNACLVCCNVNTNYMVIVQNKRKQITLSQTNGVKVTGAMTMTEVPGIKAKAKTKFP